MIVLLLLMMGFLYVMLGVFTVAAVDLTLFDYKTSPTSDQRNAIVIVWPVVIAYLVLFYLVPFILTGLLRGLLTIPSLLQLLKEKRK